MLFSEGGVFVFDFSVLFNNDFVIFFIDECILKFFLDDFVNYLSVLVIKNSVLRFDFLF